MKITALWKNGRKPPYMDSEEKDLNSEKVLHAVKNMSFCGLQCMAIYGLLMLAKFKSPAEICRDIENMGGIDGNLGRREKGCVAFPANA